MQNRRRAAFAFVTSSKAWEALRRGIEGRSDLDSLLEKLLSEIVLKKIKLLPLASQLLLSIL